MIAVGSVIQARVERVEPYGVYLKYGDQTVVVLAPEVSWLDKRELREWIRVGDVFDVLVTGYHYKNREIIGSIRRLHPEQNPYRQLSCLEPGTILRGKIQFLTDQDVTVVLPNGARGTVPRHAFRDSPPKAGEEVQVTIAGLEVDAGRLLLDLVATEVAAQDQPAQPSLAGVSTSFGCRRHSSYDPLTRCQSSRHLFPGSPRQAPRPGRHPRPDRPRCGRR